MTLALLVVSILGCLVVVRATTELRKAAAPGIALGSIAVFSCLVVMSDTKVSALVFGGAGRRLMQALATVAILYAVARFSGKRSRSSSWQPASPAAYLALGLAIWMVVIDICTTDISVTQLLQRLVALLVLGGIVVLGRAEALSLEAVGLSAVLAFGIASMATVATPDPTRACSAFKCGPFGAQVTGPFYNENVFAQVAFIALVLGISCKDRVLKGLVVALSLFVLYAAHSRDGQIAAVCALLIAWVWRWRGRAFRALLPVAAVTLPMLLAYIGIRLVYTSSGTDFSDRGLIWTYGREALGSSWGFGRGLDSWTADVLARDYMHSEYFLMLYSGGVLALALFVLMTTFVMIDARSAASWPIAALCLAFLVNGLVQVGWNPIAVENGAIFALVLLTGSFEARTRGASCKESSRGKPTSKWLRMV